MDHEIRPRERRGPTGAESEVPASRGSRGRSRNSGQTWMLPSGSISQAALPARRAFGKPATCCRFAATSEVVLGFPQKMGAYTSIPCRRVGPQAEAKATLNNFEGANIEPVISERSLVKKYGKC